MGDLHSESVTNRSRFASLDLALVRDPLGRAFIGGFTGQGDTQLRKLLVYRKLEINVAGWNAAVVKGATKVGIAPDLFAAYAVGHFQDDIPVINPGAPAPTVPFEMILIMPQIQTARPAIQ